MSRINTLINRFRKVDLKKSAPLNASDLPLDHQLTFEREPGESWSFRNGHIYLNEEDVEDILDQAREDVQLQSAVSEAISEYRDLVWRKGNGHFATFSIRADIVQDRILNGMRRIYDERTGGIRFQWGDGAYLMNNLNIRAIVALYHVRPTEKAKRFLKGLRSKLALILVNKNGSPHYERLNDVVKTLYNEVDNALSERTPIDVFSLPAHTGR